MSGSVTTAKKLTDMNAQIGELDDAARSTSCRGRARTARRSKACCTSRRTSIRAKKYPLLVVIHGGPTGVSRAVPFTSTIYPIDVWVPRGVLVLEPNYRGSAGYGEKFRALNVRNLGVGDAWDVLSGIDSLIAKGMVDPARVGTMGWSQGGYISAFLATHDAARFKAISVGAGISDWMTYYVNTDITPFTRQYLKATPWDDPEIYAKTSPITYIKQARTPTLIQHGATDQRVPLPNAFELYHGLQDNHVPTKLIVYQGFGGVGHGPTKPKSFRATMDHNIEWFDQYFFGAAVRDGERRRRRSLQRQNRYSSALFQRHLDRLRLSSRPPRARRSTIDRRKLLKPLRARWRGSGWRRPDRTRPAPPRHRSQSPSPARRRCSGSNRRPSSSSRRLRPTGRRSSRA